MNRVVPVYLISVLALTLIGCSDEAPPPAQDAAVAVDVTSLDTTADTTPPDITPPDTTPPDLATPDAPLPTCKDGKQNGAETDVDCGGGTCPAALMASSASRPATV